MSDPSKMIWPPVGRRTPVRQLKNVLLPAPLGPMMARISPRGTAKSTLFNAVSPPKRTVSFSVRRMGSVTPSARGPERSGSEAAQVGRPTSMRKPPPRPTAQAGAGSVSEYGRRHPRVAPMDTPERTGSAGPSHRLGELAGGRENGLVLRDYVEQSVFVVLDVEDEFADERLMVFLPERLVALGEVVALLDLHAFQRLDQLHRVLAPLEARLLHAELEEVDGLEVVLDVAVRQRARGVDLLQAHDGLVVELLVVGRVERRIHHGDVPIDPDEALDLLSEGRQVRRLGDGAVARELVLLGEAEVVGLRREGDRVGAGQDPEEPVEIAADLGDERGHVGDPERDASGAHDLAAALLDLFGISVAGGLPPRVVEEHHVPLLRQLAGQIRREGHGLGRRVVEGPEGEP